MTLEFLGHYDLAVMILWVFWIFFFGLVLWLHRESKREGYPLVTDRLSDRVQVVGFPGMPAPKTYLLPDGTSVTAPAPHGRGDTRELPLKQVAKFFGAPYEPVGNPMTAGVGPGSWAERRDIPDRMADGRPRIVPLRTDDSFHLESRDPDPHGMRVEGADGRVGGIVKDVWVDRSESMIRYFEVETGEGPATRRVLLPHNFCRILGDRNMIRVNAVLAKHFADVPGTKSGDQVTLLEEDKIMGYYGAGWLYATPQRLGPIL
jgi:photosynthetic reaction center H subunit